MSERVPTVLLAIICVAWAGHDFFVADYAMSGVMGLLAINFFAMSFFLR